MIEGMCQAYHWSFEDAMRRTLPQVIMLNHAAWLTRKRLDLKTGDGENGKPRKLKGFTTKNPTVTPDGRKLEDMDSESFAAYFHM
jgi:hypothetical protein